MSELPLLLLVGFAVACFIYIDVLERSGAGRDWALAWVLLYSAAVLTETGLPDPSVLESLGHALGTTFTLFLLRGALRIRERPYPAWLVPGVLAVAASRTALDLAGFETTVWLLGLATEMPLLATAAFLMWPGRSGAPFERLVASALVAIAITTVSHSMARIAGSSPPWILGAFMASAVATAALQLAALLERVRKREANLLAEHAAQTRELDALVEAVPDGIMMVGQSSEIRRINRTLAGFAGIEDRAAVIGVRGRHVIAPTLARLDEESQQRFMERFAELDSAAEPELIDFEARVVEPDERTLVISASQVRAEDGEWLGRVWTARDVTGERRLAQRLYHAQRMETLGTLAGGIAHDFNNQLTAILGNAQLAREGAEADEELRGLLSDIEASAERCAELTRGLLAFSRQTVPDVRAVNVEDALHEVESVIRSSLPPDVELAVELEPALPHVAADPTQLHRALTNLGVNARDAVGDAGRIVLGARLLADDGAAQRVEIVVSDDGVGMDAELRERIFDPFFTTKPVGAGTGLGLSIVYGIIESHGATMKAESEPGEGSYFRLQWPVARGHASADARKGGKATEAARYDGELVLLAEDEDAVRRLARLALEQRGFRVLEARDGDEAVKAFDEQADEIAAAVVDLSMPRRTGVDAIASMRARRPDLPIVLMTGHLDRDQAEDAPSDVPVLLKPFRPDDLSAEVCKLLAGA